MSLHIIRTMRLAHCKLGPDRCEKCREMDQEQICLLDIDPPDQGMVQRRVIQVSLDGEDVWREYEILRSFETQAEAFAYANEQGIDDVEF